ncbi:MAG: tetratricopeptide repeat protein [Hahellaceae bacterium]|nr:tetratricopeptide repeat protein [Hahellaceae bacterium]MCP5213148.1 tetratricopeptide repeat protein [Hahellaceae bacterium]
MTRQHLKESALKLTKNIILASLLLPVASFALGWSGNQLDGAPCVGKGQGFGPYDYVRAKSGQDPEYYQSTRLWEIDRIHFGKGMTNMQSEPLTYQSSRVIAGEFDYTLRAFPTHIGALNAIAELELKRIESNKLAQKQSEVIRPFQTPPECYFIRAAVYKSDQANIPLLHAIYLHRLKKYNEAANYYEKSLAIEDENPEAHYNYGLVLIKLNRYDDAKEHAVKAYKQGHQLSGLKSLLQEKGKWDD